MTRALPLLLALTACTTGPHPIDWEQYRRDTAHAPLIACAIDPAKITLYSPPWFRSPIDGTKVRGEYDHQTDTIAVIRQRSAIYHNLAHRGVRLAGLAMSEANEELFVIRYLSVHFPGMQNSVTTGAERRQARERWSETDVKEADRKGCD